MTHQGRAYEFVYDADGSVAAYRNGLPYGQKIEMGKVVTFEPGQAQVFGDSVAPVFEATAGTSRWWRTRQPLPI